MKKILLVAALTLPLAQIACQPEPSSTGNAEPTIAINTDTGTCAACGMVMREQPATRGQVIHRDGTRGLLVFDR